MQMASRRPEHVRHADRELDSLLTRNEGDGVLFELRGEPRMPRVRPVPLSTAPLPCEVEQPWRDTYRRLRESAPHRSPADPRPDPSSTSRSSGAPATSRTGPPGSTGAACPGPSTPSCTVPGRTAGPAASRPGRCWSAARATRTDHASRRSGDHRWEDSPRAAEPAAGAMWIEETRGGSGSRAIEELGRRRSSGTVRPVSTPDGRQRVRQGLFGEPTTERHAVRRTGARWSSHLAAVEGAQSMVRG